MGVDNQTITIVAQLAALNALATPVIVAAITKTKWRGAVKSAAALVCVLVSAALALLQQGTNFTDIAVAIPVCAVAVDQVYKRYWKDSGMLLWLSQITDTLMGEKKVE